MANANITKNIFLCSAKCMLMAYNMHRDRNDNIVEELDEYERHIIDQGHMIGKIARSLYQEGVLVSEKEGAAAAARTASLMADPAVKVIFEPAFINDGMIARADIIVREESADTAPGGHDGWKLIEVKSAVYDETDKKISDIKRKYLPDAAYTLMIMRSCGVEVADVSLMLISKNYRRGMGNEDLFHFFDVSSEILNHLQKAEERRDSVRSALNAGEPPRWSIKTACKKCDYYKECEASAIEYPIFTLNNIKPASLNKIAALGNLSIRDIPDEFIVKSNSVIWRMMHRSVKTGRKEFIGKNFGAELKKVQWPAYYLDFETLAAPLPFYDGLAPHEMAIVQYSLHVKDSPDDPDENIRHFEYIVKPRSDCRREILERLIADLGESGSIIVYSNFESSRLNEAARLFPDLAPQLNAIISRLFDLCRFLKENYYHLNFEGSYSIKKTLPVLVPGMSYDRLAVHNGGEAIVKLHGIITGGLSGAECSQAERELLEYCCQDTLAMVKLHEKLIAMN